jgi:cyanophycin synthetase
MAGDKPLTHRLLAEAGYPVPPHMAFSFPHLSAAELFLSKLDGKAVVKPARGTGGGNGVTTGVDSRRSLRRAVFRAAAWDRDLLIEAQLEGASFRLLYLDGQFVDAVRRDPPVVVGDGRRTVRQLMAEETERRLASDPIVALHPLSLDLASRTALRAQGLSPSSTPRAGHRVVVKSVVNQNAAADNHCVRDELHASIIETGRKIVDLFGIELGGIDILTPDVAAPLADVGGVINEVNTTPGLHHHVLVSDVSQAVQVGEMILEYLFSRDQPERDEDGSPQSPGAS